MAIERTCCLAAIAATLSVAWPAIARAPAGSAAPGWSERGVFVLGSLVFDIRSRSFRSGPFVDRIEDCSNSEFYCLRTLDFELVLPRHCRAIAVGDVWRVGEAETHVLYHDASGVLPFTYLGNPRRPSIVYRYGINGVGAIYWDYARGVDLVAMARNGSLRHWQRGGGADHWLTRIYNELITYDAFGQCRRRD